MAQTKLRSYTRSQCDGKEKDEDKQEKKPRNALKIHRSKKGKTVKEHKHRKTVSKRISLLLLLTEKMRCSFVFLKYQNKGKINCE